MKRCRQTGLSLVEMMAALLVGLLLAAAVAEMLLSNKKGLSLLPSPTRRQNAVHKAIELIGRSVRNAGYFGCSGYAIRKAQPGLNLVVSGTDGAPPANRFDAHPGTDILGLSGSRVVQPPFTAQAGAEQRFKPDDQLLISHCSDLQAISFRNIQGKSLGELGLPADSQILRPFKRHFFVRSHDPANGGGPTTALWVQELDGNAQLLVPGIQDFQVEYGLDWNADRQVDGYLDASAVGKADAWLQVVSVWLTLCYGDEQRYSTLFSIRNRLP